MQVQTYGQKYKNNAAAAAAAAATNHDNKQNKKHAPVRFHRDPLPLQRLQRKR
jgi:hypothetical protein